MIQSRALRRKHDLVPQDSFKKKELEDLKIRHRIMDTAEEYEDRKGGKKRIGSVTRQSASLRACVTVELILRKQNLQQLSTKVKPLIRGGRPSFHGQVFLIKPILYKHAIVSLLFFPVTNGRGNIASLSKLRNFNYEELPLLID